MALRKIRAFQKTIFSVKKSAVFSILMLPGSIIGPAQAQLFNQPVPRYYPAPHYQPRPYPEMIYTQPAPIISVAPAPATDFGSVCVTPAGECGTYRAVPPGAGCSCRIPGYGQVTGSAQ